MASKKEPYLTKQVNVRTGKRKIQKLIAQGWELTSQHVGGVYARQAILRKPNPKYRGN